MELQVFARRRSKLRHDGGIDVITPGLIGGWVHSSTVPLTDVRLLVGPHLLSQAPINQPRQDVCQSLGEQGAFGFQLQVSGDFPAVAFEQAPRVLALSADGAASVELDYLLQRSSTAERLHQVLDPEVRGAVGHFDGLSPQGDALQGWAYRLGQAASEPIQVWLHVSGQPPLALRCDHHRPGMAAQGHPEHCGFQVELDQLPSSWAGQEVQASFDSAGEILLPWAGTCCLPGLAAAAAAPLLMHPASGSPYAAKVASAPAELQKSWQALEEYRQFLDGLELQVSRAEELQQHVRTRQALEASRPLRKRDRLLRLLGGGARR